MIEFRLKNKLDYKGLSRLCGVSSSLIGMVEHGDVTHPNIVEKLKKLYSLTDEQAEELLPKHRRPHDPEYEPDKYVSEADKGVAVRIEPSRQGLYERYKGERYSKELKDHSKRSSY